MDALAFGSISIPSAIVRWQDYGLYAEFKARLAPEGDGFDRWIRRFHPIDQTKRSRTLAQIRRILQKLA